MKFKIIIGIIISLICNCSYSQNVTRFSYEKYISSDGDSLLYRELGPDYNLSRKYPLVIFLHGSGERGNDNEAQLKWGVMSFSTDINMALHPAIIIAPQCPEGMTWADYSEEKIKFNPKPTKPMKLLIELIQQKMRTENVDTNRIYITGLSMGGYGTYDAVCRNPQLFAAALPVCGAGDINKAATIAHVPIWIIHGAEDPAVNTNYSYEMAVALVKVGARPGLTIYPETGHFSWIQAYSDPLVIEWLFRQHK